MLGGYGRDGFFAHGGGAEEDRGNGGEVVLFEEGLILDHGDHDGRDEVEGIDLEALDCFEERFEREAGEVDDVVAAVDGEMADQDTGVDVGLGEETEDHFRVLRGVGESGALDVTTRFLKGGYLEDVGDYIAV